MLFIFYLEVLPRTSGEGDQDMQNYIHQPTSMVTDYNKDAQVIDHRLLHLFGGQINCYQNPYNGYTPPMSLHFLTPNGNLLFTIITFILSMLILLKFIYYSVKFVVIKLLILIGVFIKIKKILIVNLNVSAL